MEPSHNDSGQELEQFRAYLRLLARLQVDERLLGKVDLSGVVQQTLLEASQAQARMRQPGESPRAAWLRQILAHNLRDEVRKFHTAGRDVERERSLDASLEESSSRLEAWLAVDQPSPSAQVIQQERLLRLAGALEQLPPDQRLAVEAHHLKGVPLADIAQSLGRSRGAVAALLFRGLRKLRELLQDLAEE